MSDIATLQVDTQVVTQGGVYRSKRARPSKRISHSRSMRTSYIPRIPANRDSKSFWHFGYPISQDEFHELVLTHSPHDYEAHKDDPEEWISTLLSCASLASGWSGIRHVFVEGSGDMVGENWQTFCGVHPAWVGKRVISFFVVISELNPRLMDHPPSRRTLEMHNAVFRKEPVWMKDAFTKKKARKYYRYDF